MQVFKVVEADFLYYCRAFHHVHPGNPLNAADAELYMTESFRQSEVKEDLGYFQCSYCRQYSKHGFCTEVGLHAYKFHGLDIITFDGLSRHTSHCSKVTTIMKAEEVLKSITAL